MSKRRNPGKQYLPTILEQARDELFSHILRCAVLEAAEEHRKEWLDDTIEYLAERYPDLSAPQLGELRVLGERFCGPVVTRGREAEVGAA